MKIKALGAMLALVVGMVVASSLAAGQQPAPIVHVPAQQQPANTPLLVQAEVNATGAEVDLMLGTARSRMVFRMTASPDSGLVETLVPGELVQAPAVSYFFRIWTDNGRRYQDSQTYQVTITDEPPLAGEIGDNVPVGVSAISSSREVWFYDSDYYSNTVGGWTISVTYPSPFHTNNADNGTSSWRAVTSQLNATRDPSTMTTPHKGLDLSAPSSSQHSIYPVAPGKTYLSGLITDAGKYIIVRHDPDGDSVYEYWTAYLHLDHLGSIWENADGTLKYPCPVADVTTQTYLGYVQTQAHLHLSIRDTNARDLPQTRFWANSTSWSGRTYVDFIKKPTASHHTISVQAYLVVDGGSPTALQNVYMWYRRYGSTGALTRVAMTSTDGMNWSYHFGTYVPGDHIEYYIGAERPGVTSTLVSYRPCYYNQYLSGGVYYSEPPNIYFTAVLQD